MSITDITDGHVYETLSDAISKSKDGDVIELTAGTYTEDFPTISHTLTIRGVGGLAHLMTPAQPTNGKAILVMDAPNLVLDGLELSGASVPDQNGAGVRFESGGNLTIRNSWIHNNQDGLLTGAIPGATVTIDHSEINDNGAGDGLTHNVYVGIIDLLTITNSYIHNAMGGHEIKSRASQTIISDNRIEDGSAASSYSIDLPNGGIAKIINNHIEKGPNSPNSAVIHFGGEVASVGISSLNIEGNTILDDRPGNTLLLLNQAGETVVPTIQGNVLTGFQIDAALAINNVFSSVTTSVDISQPLSVSCFLAGTKLLATIGEIPVERLMVGDELLTVDGPERITWVGRRSIEAARHPEPERILPIKIDADAFGPGQPATALFLSPDHSIFRYGALIPIGLLVNGSNVQQVRRQTVIYHHVELERHGILLAEGLPVESYLETGNRVNFDGATTALHPDFWLHQWEANGYAPLTMTGPVVDRVRNELHRRGRMVARRHW